MEGSSARVKRRPSGLTALAAMCSRRRGHSSAAELDSTRGEGMFGSREVTLSMIFGEGCVHAMSMDMRPAAPRDSAGMLAALGILAYAASMMTHEALGHGGYCLAAGGHTVVLTPWWETCAFRGEATLGIKAAGPGVQFGAGLLAWLWLHLSTPKAVRLRCFLWLYIVFNLLVSAGYVAFSGLTKLGDAAELIAGLSPALVWRGGLILLGSAVYFLAMQIAAFELRRFAGLDDRVRRSFALSGFLTSRLECLRAVLLFRTS